MCTAVRHIGAIKLKFLAVAILCEAIRAASPDRYFCGISWWF